MKKYAVILSVMICALFCLIPIVRVKADDTLTTADTLDTVEAAEETVAKTEEKAGLDLSSVKAIVAGAIITAAAVAGALGMAFSIGKAVDSTARQPEAGADIRSSMMLGLVFIETAIIYALIVAILVVFVL